MEVSLQMATYYRLPVFLEITLSGWCLLDGADPRQAESGSVAVSLFGNICLLVLFIFFRVVRVPVVKQKSFSECVYT